MAEYSGVEMADGMPAALDLALEKMRDFLGNGEGFVLMALRQDRRGGATLGMGHGLLTEKGLKSLPGACRDFGHRLQNVFEEGSQARQLN